MKTAGIRVARQSLSLLLAEVKQGREITLTDRGQAVARLVPAEAAAHPPLRSHRKLRAAIHLAGAPLSCTIGEERGDRI